MELGPQDELSKAQAMPPKELAKVSVPIAEALESPPSPVPVTGQAEGGVGHSMVEGAVEKAEEIQEEASAKATEVASLEPAALDKEVAKDVAEEEAKERLAPSPIPPRAISPAPADASVAAQEGAESSQKEDGVGHSMVEGADERADDMQEKAKAEAKEDASLEPAALDKDVAMVVAEEEAKERQPSPVPPHPISPAPLSKAPSPSPAQQADVTAARKRGREEDAPTDSKSPSKRAKPDTADTLRLPSSLSHLSHPPTRVLYIKNLRRPLMLNSLHDYISPTEPSSSLLPAPRAPFSVAAYPSLWLSGIKSHAYAVFDGAEEALRAAQRIEGDVWPEVTGAALHVEFIPEEEVTRLVEKEEEAWLNGRRNMDLEVRKEGDNWAFELVPTGGASRGANAPPPPPPVPRGARPDAGYAGRNGAGRPMLSGANAIGRAPANADLGPRSRNGGPRDTFARAPPPHRADQGRYGAPSSRPFERRTRSRPVLVWREGPGGR